MCVSGWLYWNAFKRYRSRIAFSSAHLLALLALASCITTEGTWSVVSHWIAIESAFMLVPITLAYALGYLSGKYVRATAWWIATWIYGFASGVSASSWAIQHFDLKLVW